MGEENKYLYYKIDFEDWGEEYNCTIVETINDVRDYIQLAEIYLDDESRKTKVIVTGIGMT